MISVSGEEPLGHIRDDRVRYALGFQPADDFLSRCATPPKLSDLGLSNGSIIDQTTFTQFFDQPIDSQQ